MKGRCLFLPELLQELLDKKVKVFIGVLMRLKLLGRKVGWQNERSSFFEVLVMLVAEQLLTSVFLSGVF